MLVTVGRIGRPHGLRGEVVVSPSTDDPEGRFATGTVLVTDPPDRGPLTVRHSRRAGAVVVVGFEQVTSRTDAETLRGIGLLLDTDQLVDPLGEDEYYDQQLVGLTVVDPTGAVLGVVTDVLHPPASPVLQVARVPEGAGDELVPFVRAIVTAVDLDGGRLVVDPPDGMFA